MLKIKGMCMILLSMILLLCACESGDKMKINISDTDKYINELLTVEYSDDQLNLINSLNIDINELNTKYPIQCIRKYNNSYYVVYKSSKSVLIITYDSNGKKILGNIYIATKLKDDFSVIKIGQTIENVKTLDTNGDYTFLYTGRSDTPRVSYHCTIDGYMIQIFYDNKNKIIDITSKLI